jgi:transcriptional regulator with XRE-family HTH domain
MTLVSDNIRYLRKLNGLTQEQFSRKISIKRSLLGAYEEGRANPNAQNMQAIAKAFNTTVELLTRQDLRKLRETPNLSIPLGQSKKDQELFISRPERNQETGSSIRSDGKLVSDDDPFQHPDFPDIFATAGITPPAQTPEPQPLSSVLNKYYRPQEEPRRTTSVAPTNRPERDNPAPPVITSPVRPTPDRTHPASRPVDHLFEPQSVTQSPSARPSELLSFNNVYEGPGPATRPQLPTQSTATAIPIVMQSQFAEYGQRYQQAGFVQQLPAMHMPTLPDGHYRAFEAGDDFTFSGALLVGQFVRNWFDIVDGQLYILLIRAEAGMASGVCCRRIYNQVKVKGTLLLTADRADIPSREIALKDVLEVWEVRAFFSQQLPPSMPNTDRLRQLVDELRFEVERL